MTPPNPQQSTRDRVKAKFPGSFDPTHHDVEIRAALDELYAELCPPLDADVAAEIEALTSEAINVAKDPFDVGLIKAAIDRAFALGQRQSAQPGSVERVGAITRARDLLRQFASMRRKIGPIATQAQSIAWELSAVIDSTPATSDKEARVKELENELADTAIEWADTVGDPYHLGGRCAPLRSLYESAKDVQRARAALPTAPTEGE